MRPKDWRENEIKKGQDRNLCEEEKMDDGGGEEEWIRERERVCEKEGERVFSYIVFFNAKFVISNTIKLSINYLNNATIPTL